MHTDYNFSDTVQASANEQQRNRVKVYGLDSSYSGLGSVACECSNESSGSTKGQEFLISRVTVGFLRIS